MGLFGGGNNNNAAKEARKAEARRQKLIAEGRYQVDQALSGFDPAFFSGIADAYTANYLPQLDDQFSDAQALTTKRLASQGILNSSMSDKKSADLAEAYNFERQGIASRGVDAANAARNTIEQSRADLYGQLDAGASPATAAAGAATAAAQARQQASYSPLGDVFGNLLNQAAYGMMAYPVQQPGASTARGGSLSFTPRSSSREIR